MRDPSLEEVLESNFDYLSTGLYTAIPGIIVAIRDGLISSFVDVKPTINMVSEDDAPIPRPTVLNVPLIFPVSKTGGITFNVDVGDSVLLVYSMRGLDTWKRGDGGDATPTDFRKLDSRDAIAIPGLQTLSASVNNPSKRSNPHDTKDTVIVAGIGTASETEVRLKPDGDVIVNAPSKTILNTGYAEVNAPEIKLNGNTHITGTLIVDKLLSFYNGIQGIQGVGTNNISGGWNISGGSLTHNGVSIGSDHRHSGVQSGNGTSGTPV